MTITLDASIIFAFASVGIVLEHIPADENVERDLWQYSDGVADPIVELWVGINGRNLPAVFGSYTAGDFGDEYSLSGTMSEWLENFGDELPAMGKCQKLSW